MAFVCRRTGGQIAVEPRLAAVIQFENLVGLDFGDGERIADEETAGLHLLLNFVP